jgi:hypothetical protein
MTDKFVGQEAVYAILRFDPPYDGVIDPQRDVVVKEIVRDLELAQAEVERLNALSADRGARYWLLTTRLYPAGLASGPEEGK